MARGPFFGLKPQQLLTFTAPTPAGGYDEQGDPLPGTPGEVVTVTVQPDDATAQEKTRLGVDTATSAFKLTLVDPMRDLRLQAGMSAPMTVSGKPGVLRLVPSIDSRLDPVRDALGDVVFGVWNGL